MLYMVYHRVCMLGVTLIVRTRFLLVTLKKFILYVLEHEVIENWYKMQATLNIQNAEHN